MLSNCVFRFQSRVSTPCYINQITQIKRLSHFRTRPKDTGKIIVEAKKSNISKSPLKMKFLVSLIRKTWLPDALVQMKFSPKRKCDEVAKILLRAASLARIYHGVKPEELYIKEVMVSKGTSQKRRRIMGRGRTGIAIKRSSHVTIRVEKIDFQHRIDNAINIHWRKKWLDWYRKSKMMTKIQEEISNYPVGAIKHTPIYS